MTRKPSRDGRLDGGNKRQMSSSMSQQKIIIDLQIEKVELHQTENAWRPAKLSEAPAADGQVGYFLFVLSFKM
jgi:hypothetical protein